MCCACVRGHHHQSMSHQGRCYCGCPGSFDGSGHQINRGQTTAGLRHRLGRLEAEVKTLQEELDSLHDENE